ncbi:TPA: hypothetical protein ACT195_004044 [Raoultella planticola]|uniref:hypothetical protein n=1 Tax=Raoultella TaxID=160674 RepID=UPI00294688D0|nr:hypothetical protein [Raoultella planticola]HED2590607.1 hypothetical protein [Raoultella planticola]
MKRKEKIHKINKIKGLLSGEYDVGVHPKQSSCLRILMKREGSKEEFITQYYFTDKITVERIHIFRRDPTEEWDSPIDTHVYKSEFPLTDEGYRECTEIFTHKISHELINEVNCLISAVITYPALNINEIIKGNVL